jgi:hypothetical protein
MKYFMVNKIRKLAVCLKNKSVNVVEMDWLREIKQLSLPVGKLHVFKYCVLRWFLWHDCRFQENITEVEDIDNWRLNSDFVFKFGSKDFDITFCNHSASKNYRVILGVSVLFSKSMVSCTLDLSRIFMKIELNA